MSRTTYLFLGALLLGAAAFWVREPLAEDQSLAEATRLQRDLDARSATLAERTKERAIALAELGPRSWMEALTAHLEAERKLTGTTYAGYAEDSLVCWSGPLVSGTHEPQASGIRGFRNERGVYLHAWHGAGAFVLHAWQPIWTEPPVENRYLQRGFHPSWRAPAGLLAVEADGDGPSVSGPQGVPLFQLAWRDGALEFGAWLWLKLLLSALACILLVVAIWRWSLRSVYNGHAMQGLLQFICSLVLLRGFSLLALPSSSFTRIALFDPAIYATSSVFGSIGDLLINALLLLLFALFIRRTFADHAALPGGLATGLITWCVSLAFATWITRLIIGLVNDSSVALDLYHVQGLGVFSLLAVVAIAFLLGAWVVFTLALMDAWVPGKRPATVWGSLVVALGLSIVLHLLADVLDTVQFLWPLPILALLIFGRGRSNRFVQLVLGVALLAAFCAHLLTRYSERREHRDRAVLAERLATREDPVVERMFRETAPTLRRDKEVYALLSGDRGCVPNDLDRSVRQRYFGGYWERYDVRLFALDSKGQVLCATDPGSPRSFSEEQGPMDLPFAASDMPDLFIEEQAGRSPFYHARVAVMPNDSLQPAQLIIELHPRTATQGLGFPELLLAGDDPVARKAERYDYARYENGKLVERRGEYVHPLQWTPRTGMEGMLRWQEQGYDHLAKGDEAATLIVLSLPVPDLLDKATTFSYLFAIFSVLLTLLFTGRAMVRERGLPTLGIGAKVRIALLLFSLVSLVVFGFGTQQLLSHQFDERFEVNILEKARSVHQELQQKLDGEPALDKRHAPYLDHLLARLSNVFFTDMTVYTTKGEMLSTSRPQIFANGLLGTQMDPAAYRELVLRGLGSFIHQESIGSAQFRTAYMPLRDRRGQVLAILALPGFTDQLQQEEERTGVLVAVVNLFVLLFALSILVAVFISNWTTRPLDLLKNALSRVGLQGGNEPIRYRGDDEIGQLVEVYNRKVEELRDSAERLARSERESAWREMARQVAHEIKNPLTPMKLSIQHFQRTWTPDVPDAAERLERFSRAMVEQIDTLSGIASAFSNFAQMPRAQAEDLDLAEVAEAALSVFRATPGMQCELQRETTGPLPVHADREQLLRVFNNLIKNAVQAIPDGQEGRITVVLRQAKGEAIAEVHDNGTGIAEEDRERIFRPNFTTKGSGMGLGLAMVQRMVEGAGGRVWFESRVGEGSTFFVALPLRG